jgi:hypothetical protein
VFGRRRRRPWPQAANHYVSATQRCDSSFTPPDARANRVVSKAASASVSARLLKTITPCGTTGCAGDCRSGAVGSQGPARRVDALSRAATKGTDAAQRQSLACSARPVTPCSTHIAVEERVASTMRSLGLRSAQLRKNEFDRQNVNLCVIVAGWASPTETVGSVWSCERLRSRSPTSRASRFEKYEQEREGGPTT